MQNNKFKNDHKNFAGQTILTCRDVWYYVDTTNISCLIVKLGKKKPRKIALIRVAAIMEKQLGKYARTTILSKLVCWF